MGKAREKVRIYPIVYDAAKSGDFDSLKAIISGNGEDIFHQTTPKGNNILHVAAQYKQVQFIEHLLQCQSGPSLLWQVNYKGDTPLHVAANVGSCEAVGCFIDLTKSLDWVVENAQDDACKELLRKLNSSKETALHYAVRGGYDRLVKMLIEEDPQLCDITNTTDESPLYLAAHRGLSGITELILGAFSFSYSYKGPRGSTALHATYFRPESNWWKIIMKIPEVIRKADDIGWTSLHYYASGGYVNAVRLLLQIDTLAAYDLDKEGQSALHIAALCGRVNVIDELLRSCPDACDIMNTKEQTALHVAVMGGRVNVVKYVLGMPDLEYLINEQDADGNTALHLASLHRQYNIIYILARDKRVDRLAMNKDHLTALDIFDAHKEVGYKAAKVKHVLENSHGFLSFQGKMSEYVKKKLNKQLVEGQPVVSMTTGSEFPDRENVDLSKKRYIDLQVLVAVLIATVTFAATLTMPGGYSNDGMAILASKASFKAFVILNTIAFVFSCMALSTQTDATSESGHLWIRYANVTGKFTDIAASAMVLAYLCSTYAVLPRTMGLGIVPIVVLGCVLTVYFIGAILDPHYGLHGPFVKYARNLMFDYGML